jgi:hypothetical protein
MLSLILISLEFSNQVFTFFFFFIEQLVRKYNSGTNEGTFILYFALGKKYDGFGPEYKISLSFSDVLADRNRRDRSICTAAPTCFPYPFLFPLYCML